MCVCMYIYMYVCTLHTHTYTTPTPWKATLEDNDEGLDSSSTATMEPFSRRGVLIFFFLVIMCKSTKKMRFLFYLFFFPIFKMIYSSVSFFYQCPFHNPKHTIKLILWELHIKEAKKWCVKEGWGNSWNECEIWRGMVAFLVCNITNTLCAFHLSD